jgi:hypothetical protein
LFVTALHHLLNGQLNDGIVDHNPKSCIVCVPELGNISDAESGDDFKPASAKVRSLNMFTEIDFYTQKCILLSETLI